MKRKCLRCSADFEIHVGTNYAYCKSCVAHFREFAEAAQSGLRGGTKKSQTFADPAQRLRPKECPVSVVEQGHDFCGICGCDALEEEYGHTIYGCGTHNVCRNCKTILDFVHDDGD